MKLENDIGEKLVFENNKTLFFIWQRLVKLFGVRWLLGLSAAIISLLFFNWLAGEVLRGETKTFDESARIFVHQFASPFITDAMRFFSFIGSTLFLIVLSLFVIIAFIWRNRRRAVFLFIITMLGAIILNYVLKNSFQRVRPEPYFDTPLPSSYSFPSGHALFALCFYGIIAWLVYARIKSKVASFYLWVVAFFLIFFIGLSRVYLSVHYASDVLAGYFAALFWVITVITCDYWLSRQSKNTQI